MYRLFLVEDDRGIAEAITAQTTLWDMETVCAKDFRRVMAEFTECAPQLVLLDISLPFYDGYHWCREIRSVSRVPVIFISSAADNLNIVMAMNMGADDFIAKPFDQSVLMAKINALLRRTYDFGGTLPVLEHRGAAEHRGRDPGLRGGKAGADEERIPHPPGPDAVQGKDRQPGEAHGAAVGIG